MAANTPKKRTTTKRTQQSQTGTRQRQMGAGAKRGTTAHRTAASKK